jgi:hypothetical protein
MMSIDNNSYFLLITVSFALVAIAGFWFFQRRGKVKVQGLLGTRFDLDASNQPSVRPLAVNGSDARGRNARPAAKDETGRGVGLSRVKVEGTITASSIPGKPYPKA